MKDTTKRTISNLFVSQVNNTRAIEGAKTAPWWLAVILFVLGTFLPVIPIMTSQANTYGAQFLAGNVYKFDQHLVTETVELAKEDRKIRFAVENNELLAYKKVDGTEQLYKQTWNGLEDMTPVAIYNAKSTVTYGSKTYETVTRKLEIYYTDRIYNSNDKNNTNTVYNMLKTITNQKFVLYSEDANAPVAYRGDAISKYAGYNTYTPSFLLLSKDSMFAYIYKTDTSTISSYTSNGLNWNNFKTDDLFKDLSVTSDIKTANPNSAYYVSSVMRNYKDLFNKAFANQKTRNFWMMSGIFYGIFFGLNLFMGLMLFLLTRGKNNPNRGLNIFTTEAIAGWICVAPGLLAMIFGFIFAQAQQIAFIVLLGLRAMWLAMRQLNPKY